MKSAVNLGVERNKPLVLQTRTGQKTQGRWCLTLIDFSLGLAVSCLQPRTTNFSPLDDIGLPTSNLHASNWALDKAWKLRTCALLQHR